MNSSNFYLSYYHNNFKYVSFSCGKTWRTFSKFTIISILIKTGEDLGKDFKTVKQI